MIKRALNWVAAFFLLVGLQWWILVKNSTFPLSRVSPSAGIFPDALCEIADETSEALVATDRQAATVLEDMTFSMASHVDSDLYYMRREGRIFPVPNHTQCQVEKVEQLPVENLQLVRIRIRGPMNRTLSVYALSPVVHPARK